MLFAMKSSYLFLALAGIVLGLYACRSHKYTAASLPDEVLIFGNGGGFTGIEHRYILCDNGQLFRQEGVGGAIEAAGYLRRRTARQAFEAIDSLGLRTLHYEKPGNVYHFFELPSGETAHRIVWDPNKSDEALPEDVRTFHAHLMELVRGEGSE